MSRRFNVVFCVAFISSIIFFYDMKAQEMQVPFCNEIRVITPAMSAGSEYFAAWPGFQQATIYKLQDSSVVMEVLYKKDGSILRERKPVTIADISLICSQIKATSNEEVINGQDLERDGRRKVIASSMAYSLAYYAWAIPTAFSTESGSVYTGSYLILGSAGYFVPMMATENSIVTKGMAKGYTYGCFLGIGHGWSLGALLTGAYDNNINFGISTLTSIGEGIGGLYYARNHHYNRAHMRTIGSLGTWGFAYGLGIPAMAESEEPLAYAASSLLVSGLGIYTGDKLARKFKPADGDVTVTNGLGIIGGTFATTLVYTFAGEDGTPAAFIGGAIIGTATGLSMGFIKTSKINYTRTDGNLIILGEFAGGLIGGGLYALADADPTVGLWFVSAGLLGGFLISDSMTIKRKRENNATGMNLSFDINPVAFQNLINKTSIQPQPGKPLLNTDLAKITLRL